MNSVRLNRLIKVLQVIFIVMLLASVGLIATACKCQHDYEQQVTKLATCGAAGEVTYTCSKCGDAYKEELPKLSSHSLSTALLSDNDGHWQKCENCDYTTKKTAHDYTTVVSNEASSCVVQGSKVKACECGRTRTDTLPLSDHKYTVYQKQGGKHWLKCENCDSTTAETEHLFNIQGTIIPSTCVKQGSSVKSCICGEETTEPLPLASHDYTKTVYNDDEHWIICAVCNAEKPNQEKTPHSFSVESFEADCEKSGKVVTVCSKCEYVHTEILPALNHDLDKENGFSKSYTDSEHYYKCNRCGKDIAEPHILEDCECPDGYNRDATCYQKGHQDQKCSVCNWRDHFTLSMTGEHNWSDEWESNDTFHWHACLNGEGVCTAKGGETQHTWDTKTTPATCTEKGREWHECSVCGHEQKSYNKVIAATGHDYETVRVITPATCTEKGEVAQRCKTCGAETTAFTAALGHSMSLYNMELTDANYHYRQCEVCGFTNTTPRNHTWIDDVKSEATCTSNGLTIRTCKYCCYTYEQVTTKNHSYVTNPDSYVEATCKSYQTHVGTCSQCGDTQIFVDEYLGYAEHNVKYYPEKAMTETEPGNRAYWQCTVCGRYFTSHGCVEELTQDQVFTYPPTFTRPESIEELIEIAKQMPNNVVSNDYYQITATVYDVDDKNHTLMISEGDSDNQWIFAVLVEKEYIYSINEDDVITLKGKLSKFDDDITLVECEVVAVDCGIEGFYSISISMDEDYSKAYVYAYVQDAEGGEGKSISLNTNYYNYVEDGDIIVVNFYIYDSNVLQKAIVNGKSVTVANGVLTITVTENIKAEFVIADKNKCSAAIRELDTNNNNGNAIVIDEYISYTYTNGGYNEEGRLHKDSHLTFYAENANITGINITYEADWLTNNPKILENTVNAIKENGAKIKVEQGDANKNSKVTITLSASDAYTALEYFANASQARVVEIVILYETCNT